MKLILASTSKYRKELLDRLNIPFECMAPGVDEDQFKVDSYTPKELVSKLSILKARAVLDKLPENSDAVVIGGDQLAHLEGEVLGKPGNYENAFKQIRALSGKEHQLLTSVCVASKEEEIEFLDIAKIKFRELSDLEIETYLKLDEPFDCAGSYKWEKSGVTLFESVKCSDHNAIMGLPLIKLASILRQEYGFSTP